jgi:polyisoprenoid-binding protein YceI
MNRKHVLPLLLFLAAALAATSAGAEVHHFTVDPNHSQVGFKVRHLLANVPGRFDDFSGSVWFDPEDIAGTLKIEGTVQTVSIDTDNEKRDNHLRSADFFECEMYPEMMLVSKDAKQKGDSYVVVADLTIRDVTKEVKLHVDVSGVMTSPFTGTPTTGMEIQGTVNRKDFGMIWNKALDAGGFVLGDEVNLQIQLEATQMPETDA